jgi:hypothetical protein
MYMAETAELVDRVSKALGVPREEVVRKGVEEFLQSQLKACLAEIYELRLRYDVKCSKELEEKIRRGLIHEHPTWEDLIVLENLEERTERIKRELDTLRS